MREPACRPAALTLALALALALALVVAVACSPSVEDAVEGLANPEEHEAARQELLLAKEGAVEPLLDALEDPQLRATRTDLVDVLAGLALRVEDPRIEAALRRHLTGDPDPRVRARIARTAGLHRREAFVDDLLTALDDADAEVVLQALIALEALRLSPDQGTARNAKAAALLGHGEERVRWEARLLVETEAARLVDQGRALVVQAQAAPAESLFHRALALAPDSKYATYRLARLAYDEGQRERGLRLLRDGGMLLDVPRLERAPVLDGVPGDAEWQGAARARGFHVFAFSHKAALPSEVDTEIRVARTDGDLWLAFTGYDDHPDSLVVKTQHEDGALWWEDIIEIYLDADLDHRSYVHLGINSIAVTADAWHPSGLGGQDEAFDTGARVAAHVGQDAWSLEVAIPFAAPRLPAPRRGDVWGFNLVRTFRGAEFSQWVRTYTGVHAPDDFGFLVFE